MRQTLSLFLMLWTTCDALAMGGPVYIDTTCQRMVATHATPELKAWLKKQCPDGDRSPAPICEDLDRFLRDVAANNNNIKSACGGSK